MLSCCLHSQNRSRSWLATSKAQHKICRQKQIAHHIRVSPCRGPSDRDTSDTLGIISWKQRDKTGSVPRPTMNTTIPKPSDCTHQKSFVSGTWSHRFRSQPLNPGQTDGGWALSYSAAAPPPAPHPLCLCTTSALEGGKSIRLMWK